MTIYLSNLCRLDQFNYKAMEKTQAKILENPQQDNGLALEESVYLSVVVPISERHDDLRKLYRQYSEQISENGYSYEFIFVLDGEDRQVLQTLKELRQESAAVKIVLLNHRVGEATALSVGLEKARGSIILTLPSYFQVDPTEIGHILKTLVDSDSDLVIGWRYPRIDSVFNRLQSRVFHGFTRALTGMSYHDVSCGVRVMNRKVAEEIQLYGDLHRFFPLLAHQRGFKVVEIPVRQSRLDVKRRLYGPGVYLRRLLDLLTLFFLYKFTKKPLRFFGLIGSVISFTGAIITAYMGLYRLLGFGGIADRPLLILGVLLLVLGVQLLSIGLLGEIIIFTHARDLKDYQVSEVLE